MLVMFDTLKYEKKKRERDQENLSLFFFFFQKLLIHGFTHLKILIDLLEEAWALCQRMEIQTIFSQTMQKSLPLGSLQGMVVEILAQIVKGAGKTGNKEDKGK